MQLKGKSQKFPYNLTNVTRNENIVHWGLWTLFICIVIASIPAGIIPGNKYGTCNKTYSSVILAYQIFASIIAVFEWVPQIVKTCKLKSCGSFSVLGMAIQTPGQLCALLVLIGSKTEWYVWVTTSCSLVLHIILLVCLLYFYFFYNGGEYKQKKGIIKLDTENEVPQTNIDAQQPKAEKDLNSNTDTTNDVLA